MSVRLIFHSYFAHIKGLPTSKEMARIRCKQNPDAKRRHVLEQGRTTITSMTEQLKIPDSNFADDAGYCDSHPGGCYARK